LTKIQNNYKSALIFIFLLAVTRYGFAQCSDAGVCIIGHVQNDSVKNELSTISIGLNYGYSGKEKDINGALNDITISSGVLNADLSLSKRSRLMAGIPYTFISGPLGYNSGVGDLALLYSYKFIIKKIHSLIISIGGKLSVADVNTIDSLPQRYMPGLGTNDLIAGATYGYQYYSVSAGYQKVFGRSANVVTRLKRGDDFFFRAGYNQRIKQLIIKTEIFTIISIQKSSVLVSGTTDTYTDVEGSNEPQVNLLASAGYFFSNNVILNIEAAIPFLKRDYNYDGLKRTFTARASVSYLFKL
jgi:hypothetical protein